MRLLFLSHRFPYPPNKGERIRAYHEIRALAERGHEVHLATFVDPGEDPRGLQDICASVTALLLGVWRPRTRALAALLGHRSLSVQYFNSPEMRRAVRLLVERIDPEAAIVYSSTMAQFVPPNLCRRTVADIVDVDSEKWRDYSRRSRAPLSIIYSTEARRLGRIEAKLLTQVPRVVVTTSREAELLQRHSGDFAAVVESLVNGVDTIRFRPNPAPDVDSGCRHVVFTGAMDYRPNVEAMLWFAQEVWPTLSRALTVKLWIVGSNPTRSILRLTRDPTITVTGFVPDVLPSLQRASVVIAPLLTARGIQNKVLEGMACAKPVVASSAVGECMPGLAAHRAAFICGTEAEYLDALSRVLSDGPLARATGERARMYVEQFHQWPVMLRRFCELVELTGRTSGESF